MRRLKQVQVKSNYLYINPVPRFLKALNSCQERTMSTSQIFSKNWAVVKANFLKHICLSASTQIDCKLDLALFSFAIHCEVWFWTTIR